MGQVVLLSGEAGIGKSRLVQMLKEHITAAPHTRIEWRGSPYHQQSALYPVIDHLQRLLREHHEASPSEQLRTLEAALTASGVALSEAVPLLAALLSLPLPASYPSLILTPQRQRQKTLETLLAWLYAEAQQQPVLLIVEDLHWVDPSTLELLSLLIDQCAQRRLCLVLTARPEFHPPWAMVAHLTSLRCDGWPRQVGRLVTHVVGDKPFPPAVLQEVVRKTDGVPLFVEELTKTVLESGLLARAGGALCVARPAATPGDPRHSARRPPGAARSPRHRESRGATGGHDRAHVCLRGGPGRRAPGRHDAPESASAAGGGGDCDAAGPTAAGNLHVQARAHSGHGLSVATAEHAAAVSSAIAQVLDRAASLRPPRRSRRWSRSTIPPLA